MKYLAKWNFRELNYPLLSVSTFDWLSEWVIVPYCKFSNFSAILWREQVNYQWDDDEVRFVLDEHAELDLHSASSLKQQSVDRHVAPLGHIIIMPSQPVFALSPECCVLSEEATNPRSTALEASTLTVTPQMRCHFLTFILYCKIQASSIHLYLKYK